tara:strand:- start:494 stop:784 length:291 start_codon:yes stop_codon:yes gene_type:complete
MSYELIGKLIVKSETIQVSEKFKKREFVVEQEDNNGGKVFINKVKFQLTQDRTSLIDDLYEGNDVKVSFNIKGTEWEKEGNTNYFTNLDAWKIERV